MLIGATVKCLVMADLDMQKYDNVACWEIT